MKVSPAPVVSTAAPADRAGQESLPAGPSRTAPPAPRVSRTLGPGRHPGPHAGQQLIGRGLLRAGRVTRQTGRLGAVDDQEIDLIQGKGGHLGPVRGRVQTPRQTAGSGLLEDVRHVVDLILQQKDISVIERVEAGPDLVPGDALVAAGEEDDGVLPALLLDLDDGVAGRFVLVDDDIGHVDAEGRQAVHQPAAVAPDAAGVGHRRPGQGQGRRLVRPLAAGEDPVAAAGQGLPRAEPRDRRGRRGRC